MLCLFSRWVLIVMIGFEIKQKPRKLRLLLFIFFKVLLYIQRVPKKCSLRTYAIFNLNGSSIDQNTKSPSYLSTHFTWEFSDQNNFQCKMGQKDGNFMFWSTLEPLVSFLGLINHTCPYWTFFGTHCILLCPKFQQIGYKSKIILKKLFDNSDVAIM